MGGFIIKRLVHALWVMAGVVSLTFFLMHFTGADPALIIALDRYGSQLVSPDTVRTLAREQGLDQPLFTQFCQWIILVADGDLGNSLRTGLPVTREILGRLPATLTLALASVGISAFMGIPLGILTAARPEGRLDRITRFLSAVKVSIPGFYTAMLLIYLFSFRLGWLPGFGTGSLRHHVLPVAVLVVGQLGFTLRVSRSAALDVLQAPWVAHARLRGVPRFRIYHAHVLRNAAVPILTYLSLQFLMALEGAVIVESIFAWPGVGRLLQESVMGRDFTLVQGLGLFFSAAIVLVNLAVDLLYQLLDRKIPMTGGRP